MYENSTTRWFRWFSFTNDENEEARTVRFDDWRGSAAVETETTGVRTRPGRWVRYHKHTRKKHTRAKNGTRNAALKRTAKHESKQWRRVSTVRGEKGYLQGGKIIYTWLGVDQSMRMKITSRMWMAISKIKWTSNKKCCGAITREESWEVFCVQYFFSHKKRGRRWRRILYYSENEKDEGKLSNFVWVSRKRERETVWLGLLSTLLIPISNGVEESKKGGKFCSTMRSC